MKLKVVICPELVGGYSVVVPALPGCVSDADTLEEARANAREAAKSWLDEAHEPELPADGDAYVTEVLRYWVPQEGADALVEEIEIEAR